jgi:serine/threonine protein kinase/CRP-like cAMP-binding protein
VIAVTDGSLWALDRNVFRAVMKKLTAVDPTRELTRALRKINLLRNLNLQQIQRLLEMMKEMVLEKDEVLLRKGQVLDTLYLITTGTCQDAVPNEQSGAPAVVGIAMPADDTAAESVTYTPSGHKYEAYDCIGEYGLLHDETNVSTSTIMAITDQVKLRYIPRTVFEETFGPLQEVIDIQIRRRESFSRGLPVASASTAKLDNNALKGTVNTDNLGVILIGNFGSLPPSSASAQAHAANTHNAQGQVCNTTVRTFLLKEVEKNGLVNCVRNTMLVVRTIVAYCNTTRNSVNAINWCLPRYHSLLRDSNAIHLLFKETIIGDVADVIHQLQELEAPPSAPNTPSAPGTPGIVKHMSQGQMHAHAGIMCDEGVAAYIISSVVRAIEVLHGMGIVYRSLQPEAIHVTLDGKVMLCDYRHPKVAAVGTRSFTLCGATDYLAPEQISNAGYGSDVDLWATGVLLFELICGVNPFAAPFEVGVYQNIAAYGSPKFRSLRFSMNAGNHSVDLINSLIVPDPAKRLGAGIAKNAMQALKRHDFFVTNGVDWDPATTALQQQTTSATVQSSSASASSAPPLPAIHPPATTAADGNTRSESGSFKERPESKDGKHAMTHQASQQFGLIQPSSLVSHESMKFLSGQQAPSHTNFYAAQQRIVRSAQAIYSELTADGVDVDVVASFSVPYYGTRWDRELEC